MDNELPRAALMRERLSNRFRPWMSGHAPLMSLAHLILEASFSFLPVLYVLLIPKLGLTYSQIGTLALMMSITGAATQPLFGWLSDRTDPRVIVVISLMWGGALMGLVGFMPSYGALAGLLLLAALGSAAFHPPAAAISSFTEARNRGRAMSLFSVGGSLGSALSPALVGVALGVFGLGATAVVIPLSAVTGLLLARRLRSVKLPDRRERTEQGTATTVGAGSFVALLAIVAVVAARSYFQMGLETYLPEWLRGNGQSLAMAGAALAIFMVAISAGSLLGGALSDRFGRMPVIVISLVLLMAGQWSMMRLTGAPQMAAVILIGLMIGASYPVTIVLAQEAWPQSVGLASAMVMGLGWMPAGLGAWVVGRVADGSTLTTGLATLIFVPAVSLVAAGVYWLAVRNRSKPFH